MVSDSRGTSYRPLVVFGVFVTLAVILNVASKVLIPIALGIFLAFILNPPVAFVQSRGVRRVYAVILVVATAAFVIAGMMTALAVQLRDLASDLPAHKDQIVLKVRDLTGKEPGIFDRLSKMIEEISVEMQGPDKGPNNRSPITIPVRVERDRTAGFGLLALLAGPLAATLGSISLTVALTISMLIFREDLRNRLFLLLGDGHLTSTTRAMDEVSTRISHYLVTQVALNSAFGTAFGIGMALIGVKYALVWGALAAVLRFVPYIGTWMAGFFPVIVSIASVGWVQPTLVVLYVVFLGVLTNYILEPKFVNRTTGVIPIALVVATAFWTWLWGPIGLILSTPITVCLSVVGKHVPSLNFLNVLLGSAAPLDPDLKFYQRLLAHDEVEAADLIEAYLVEHEPEELFDRVIIASLARARLDSERGHLLEHELLALVRTTRELLDATLGEPEECEGGPVVVVCPAHDAVEEFASELLVRLVSPGKARIQIVSPASTASEVLASVEEFDPAVVCLVNLPPGGTARSRYLCKKLRARSARLPIVASILGMSPEHEVVEMLRTAGATHLATSLVETRAQIVPLLQVTHHSETV